MPGLKKANIAVATVALGAEADFKLLKEIAADTGGNYYRTENARDLPKIFDKETRINTRTVRLRGQIGVSAGDPSPITGSISPEEGMARCRRDTLAWAGDDGVTRRLAAAPAIIFVASRRVMMFLISVKTRRDDFRSLTFALGCRYTARS